MKTFTAKVEIPKKPARYIPNCVIYKGKLAQVYKKGIGKSHIEYWSNGIDDAGEEEIFEKYIDCYKAYINSTLLEQNGITKEYVNKLLEENQENAWTDERIFNCLFQIGENPNGYFVSNTDINREMLENEISESIENKEIDINFENGIFGLQTRRLPEKTWKLIAAFGTYHKGDESDEEWADDMGYYNVHKNQLRGWFYSKEALKSLLDSGYPVSYLGVRILSIDEMSIVYDNKQAEEKKYFLAVKRYDEAKSELKQTLNSLFSESTYISEEEAKTLIAEKGILFPAIDILGHDIYGGGRYLHITDKFIYLVQNNGHDSDDWSRNNYTTGGAGAIATRINHTEKAHDFLDKVTEFSTKSIEDFKI